ncbi:MAG: hypothetical protein K6G24_12205 [Lachnospiraceae bacterium]|nr:hypothetical protein [Lachnospiraceae bacterium]
MANYNTPYDDSFRTLLTDCKRLIIPVVNEMFGEAYAGDEDVELFQNELFITEGREHKVITDSHFAIGGRERHYNIECQSSPDGSMIMRMFEYSSQIAVVNGVPTVTGFRFVFPHAGILYLRGTNYPDSYKVTLDVPGGGSAEYNMPIIKIGDYNVETVFQKKLWFLIPFLFFNYNLELIEGNEEQLNLLKTDYRRLWSRLDGLVETGELTEYEKCSIKAMCDKVARSLADKYISVSEGVNEIMGGIVLDYEAKRILQQGVQQGLQQGNVKAVCNMLRGNVEEAFIREMYPDEFEEGKKMYEDMLRSQDI